MVRTQRINKALAEFHEIQKELKQLQLSSEDWQKHDRAYQETSSAAEQIREQVRTTRGSSNRNAETDQISDSRWWQAARRLDHGAERTGRRDPPSRRLWR